VGEEAAEPVANASRQVLDVGLGKDWSSFASVAAVIPLRSLTGDLDPTVCKLHCAARGERTGRACHRRMVPGVTSPCARSLLGRCRISAARTARSAQSSLGCGLRRRSTATSCRRTSSSAFLDADERPSRI